MCRPSGALGWVGHGLSTASPRRPTEAACILYAFFGKAKAAVKDRGVAHFCAEPRSEPVCVPLRRNAGSSRQARQIGPPFENRIRPAPGRLRHSYDADASVARARAASRSARVLFARGCGPHDHGRVHALPERPSHSKPRSLVPRNPIARPIERAGCRPSSDGGTGAALRGHDRNDGLPPYRPPPLKPAATWIAGSPVLLSGKMNARRIPAERPKGLAYPLTCLLR